MQRSLALEQSPPLVAVQRFFLCSPLFALLAGALLLWYGAPALQSRWSPATLALTHLLTLGALGMAMVGALLQILPVVAAMPLAGSRIMAPCVHAMLGSGTLLLAAAFLSMWPILFQGALVLLLGALGWLLAVLVPGLWHPHPPGAAPMLGTLRLALAALLVTLLLAALLASAFGWPGALRGAASLPLMLITDLHAAWGVFGWGGLLLVGVAFQVVPMFQITPLYQRPLEQVLGTLVLLSLVLYSVAALLEHDSVLAWVSGAAVLICHAGFAIATLRLLAQRKRAADPMTLFWRLAMANLLACAVLWMVPAAYAGSGQPLALGVLAIVGFLYSTINGMLYKIVPFLAWHHLQHHAAPGERVPAIKHLLSERRARGQFWLHCMALLLLLGACWWPWQLARPAALALCASSLWLLLNLCSATQQCRPGRQ